MEYQRLKTKFGIVIIKDAEDSELEELKDIYKSIFEKHNIFQRSPKEILEYLKESNRKNSEVGGGCIVAKLEGKTVGGVVVKKESEDLEGKHVVWKYNHLGVAPDYSGQGIGSALMNAADQKIKNLIKEGKIKTAKIEAGVSENNKDVLEFAKKCSFEIEGELKSHYRYGELVYVLGKGIVR